jgi:hypothetical protein
MEVYKCLQGGVEMTKKPKSFRFNEEDVNKLEKVHAYFKSNYSARVSTDNMDNLHRWSEAQTIAVLIRNKHDELVRQGEIKN